GLLRICIISTSMNALDTSRLQLSAPYTVIREGEEYLFRTDYDILYAVSFQTYDAIPGMTAYWFDLSNRSHRASPNDVKVRETIICIIEEFFYQNPDILLYMCDNADEQQAMRARLFLRWFNGYEQQKKYAIRTALLTEEGIDSYIALIIQRSHPQFDEITTLFDQEIAMFRDNKP
ncbi:MAG: hypothetical protein IKZ83_04965, partial [Prevotella sp.]|nr:hypothetical protein [Prevotella sp.]